MFHKRFTLRVDYLRRDIGEIDALERLIDMELSRLAFVIASVPIEHAIGGVTVLLDLDQHIAGANGMETSSGQKNGVAGLDRNCVGEIGDSAAAHSLLKLISRDSLAKSGQQFGAGDREGNVPKFGLRFATKFRGDFFRRMHLQRKRVVGIEQFNEQWKTRSVSHAAENGVAIARPKFV